MKYGPRTSVVLVNEKRFVWMIKWDKEKWRSSIDVFFFLFLSKERLNKRVWKSLNMLNLPRTKEDIALFVSVGELQLSH